MNGVGLPAGGWLPLYATARTNGVAAPLLLVPLLSALLLGLVLLSAGPAGASPSAAEASPSPSSSVVSLVVTPDNVVYGTPVAVSGEVLPALADQAVSITLDGAEVAAAVTGADGRYAAQFTPQRGGAVLATLVTEGVSSAPLALSVRPDVTITTATPVPFLTLHVVVSVLPAGYAGTITTTVLHNDATQATVAGQASGGSAAFDLPLWGVGQFRLRAALAADGGLAERTVAKDVRAARRRLAVGAAGAHVRGVLTALQRLKVRIPSLGSTMTRDRSDAIVAFQKAYGLPRTYVVDADDWARLDAAQPVKPRYVSPYDHLEVDKTRQILMMVRGGRLRALIAVSTGATGNTPEGVFRIQQKHPSTTSLSGGAVLYRTMGFLGNFAIHGYAPVPPYPASHGCVREPMWVADWMYDRTALGERVYIYR